MSYPLGATTTIRGSFRDEAGALANPDAVTLEVTDPAGATVTYAWPADLNRPSTGVYTRAVVLEAAGTHRYRWTGTGAIEAVFTGFLIAEPAPASSPDVYADLDLVVERAGGTLNGLSDQTAPTVDGLQAFIVSTAAQINTAITGHGHAVPVTDTNARAALAALNADGALVLALKARYPASQDRLAPLLPNAEGRWDMGLQQLAAGTHPVLAALETTTGGAVPAARLATSLWTDDPGYVPEAVAHPNTFNPYMDPETYRGMEF